MLLRPQKEYSFVCPSLRALPLAEHAQHQTLPIFGTLASAERRIQAGSGACIRRRTDHTNRYEYCPVFDVLASAGSGTCRRRLTGRTTPRRGASRRWSCLASCAGIATGTTKGAEHCCERGVCPRGWPLCAGAAVSGKPRFEPCDDGASTRVRQPARKYMTVYISDKNCPRLVTLAPNVGTRMMKRVSREDHRPVLTMQFASHNIHRDCL